METLKIATYWWAGRRQVGRLSADERDVLPLALGERAHAVGALALVEAMAAGRHSPSRPDRHYRCRWSISTLSQSASLSIRAISSPTGTPPDVGIGFDPPKYLRRGDRVRIDLEGIGSLSNSVQ